MSIIAFVIARKGICSDCFSLLFVNGGLIIAGMIALVAQGSVESEDMSDTFRKIGSTMAMRLLIGLGTWKTLIDRKILPTRRKEPAQK